MRRKIITVWVCAMMVISAFVMAADIGNDVEGKEAAGNGVMYVLHAPIRINSNADFATNANGGGDGSPGNPWLIENYDINGTGYGYCIYIGNTTDYFVVRNCNAHDASGVDSMPYYTDSGLILNNVNNGTVANNTSTHNLVDGIYLDSSSSNNIMGNNASNNGFGIYLLESHENTVINNIVSFNKHKYDGFGVLIWSSDDNVVSYNNVSNNDYGIHIVSSEGITISNNFALNNLKTGITLDNSCFSSVSNNFIALNDMGLELYHSTNTRIYHNSFISNTLQAMDDGNPDNWWNDSYPSGGNYWSDYTGEDLMSGPLQNIPGSDSVGDIPHVIDNEIMDNYPLMHVGNAISIKLVTGWNLISIPLVLKDNEVQDVLTSIDGAWDVVKYFDNNDKNDPWKTYRQGGSTNDLAEIDRQKGYWVHVIKSCNLVVFGTAPVSTEITLYAGWNLVGYPTIMERTVGDALWGTGADLVDAFDPVSPYIKEVAPTYVMKPGEGYWVHVPADTVWTVDW